MDDDTIRRQAAIDALIRKMRPHDNGDGTVTMYVMSERLVRETLNELPSVQPEQKTGTWIKMSDADETYYCCSECGEELYREWSFDPRFDLFPRRTSIAKTKYCSCCGARMEDSNE